MLVTVMYLIYVSLGLPDSLLGSGWPEMQVEFSVPSSCAGYVFMSISFMTIISSLLSPVMIRKIHTWWIMVFSILLTVIGILGFSFSGSFYMLIVFAVPYGLGAGAIDAAVNHYVANNYSGRIMNFLHCFYGVGAIISPNIMAYALSRATWHEGYRWTAYIQTGIMVICILSLPLWKGKRTAEDVRSDDTASVSETIKVPGVILTLLAFFAYCSGEATCFVWTSSYFADTRPFLGKETVASFGSLIFLGLMAGRIISGIFTNRLGDRRVIRIGMEPVFPGIQHMAPINFTRKYSAAVIGMQMASAYLGSTVMPMVFGHLQQAAGIWLMPYYLLLFAVMNLVLLELAYKAIRKDRMLNEGFSI